MQKGLGEYSQSLLRKGESGMNIQKLIVRYVLPQFEAKGLKYNNNSKNICFFNAGESIAIKFDIINSFGAKFLREKPKELKVSISIKYGSSRLTFRPDAIKNINEPVRCFFKSEADMINAFEELTAKVVNEILPKVEELARYAVASSQEYYELLSIQPKQQAQAFALKHGRDIVYSEDNKLWANRWIQGMLPERSDMRREVFEREINNIISFAAFVGELFIQKENAIWRWVTIPDSLEKKFAVYIPDKEDGYDILKHICLYWNFSADIKGLTPFLD